MVKAKLLDWMPEYYDGDNVKAIQTARDEELKGTETSQKRIIGDMYVSTAEDINLWENEYGITAAQDSSIRQRQQNMLAYIRGSGGAVTKEMIIALINSYTGTDETEVIEYPDESIIRIICHLLPTSIFDLQDMTETLYKLIQAHVGAVIDAVWSYEADTPLHFGIANKGEYIIAQTIST